MFKSKRTKLLVSLFIVISFLQPLLVSAQAIDVTGGNFGLDPIVIPFFPVFGAINPQYFTVLSWVSFLGGVVIVLVIILWVIRILLAGLEAIKSEGDQEKLQTAFKKLQSNLVGIGITFLIPIILTVIGYVLGIGTIFNWPKMLSGCPGTDYEYYFRAYFNAPAGEDPTEFATRVCGLSSAN